MELYINDQPKGTCKSYRQFRNDPMFGDGWSFLMEDSTFILINFCQIKLFNSCGKLDLLLFDSLRRV